MADVLAVETGELGDVVPFLVEVEPGDGAPHAAQPRNVLMAASATSSTTTPTIRISPGTFGWEGRGRGGVVGRRSVTSRPYPHPERGPSPLASPANATDDGGATRPT